MIWIISYDILLIMVAVLLVFASVGAIRESLSLRNKDKYRDSQ